MNLFQACQYIISSLGCLWCKPLLVPLAWCLLWMRAGTGSLERSYLDLVWNWQRGSYPSPNFRVVLLSWITLAKNTSPVLVIICNCPQFSIIFVVRIRFQGTWSILRILLASIVRTPGYVGKSYVSWEIVLPWPPMSRLLTHALYETSHKRFPLG